MEITYQGLRIQLPFEGVIGIESFSMDASFNEHVSVELGLLVEEETIEPAIHGIADGDGIEVYEDGRDGILFAGKITDTWMKKERGLCSMSLKALSYTMEWSLAPVSQSFQDLDLTYEQVLKKVLSDQPGAEIIDSVTQGAAIPDFLIQYEESDWTFLARLASHFGTFLIPDCCAAHGRAYFGLPDLGEETVLGGEEYQQIKDMDQQYRIGDAIGLLPQENIRWELAAHRSLRLAQGVRFEGISAVVTRIKYRTVRGELVRSYELSMHSIAIDGPAGAGKSTIAKRVAKELGFIYVDTGAMYRSMALYFLRHGIPAQDEEKISEACNEITVSIEYENGEQQVILNGENVNGFIRTEEVSMMTSDTSKYPKVREKLLSLQRDLAKKKDVIMDGRDIGTCVLPDADLKIFLTASPAERARRRFKELQEKGEECDLDTIEKDIIARDEQDMNREISPLRPAEDASFVDASYMAIEEVVDTVVSMYRKA